MASLNRKRTVIDGRYGNRMGRGRLPAVLLTDVVQVEPYQGVAMWGPAYPLVCLVDEVPSTVLTGQGTIAGKSLTIYAPPGSDVPEGSKITLADGRLGYASAVAGRGITAAFPVPSHLHIIVTLGVLAPTPIGAETVMVARRMLTGTQDRYGNDVYADTLIEVPGVTVGEVESDSATDDPANSRVTRRRTLVFPPGTTVGAQDRLTIRGETWGIEGEPQVIEEPTLGLTAGVVVRAVRVTG